MIPIVGIRYRTYTHCTLYRSCLLIYGMTTVRSLSFLFPDDFEGDANISVAIKSSSTVYQRDCSVDKGVRQIREDDSM